jgi:phosphatidylglycerol---prolipoprotein diacylglyceryl transferase
LKPILFHLGSYQLHTFGLLVALGFVFGLWAASRNARAAGLSPELPYDLAPWLIGGALVGARALYVISYWQRDFAGQGLMEIVAIWKGGLVFYGGLIGATAAGMFAVSRRGLPLWQVADCLAPGIALGHVFGRVGCLMNGCCYGRPSSLPWAIQYPQDHHTHPAWVHPAQMYESAMNLAFFAGLTWLHRRRRFDGQVFATYLLGYAVIRSIAEWYRGDYSVISNPAAGVFTPGQITSALIITAGAVLYGIRRRHALSSTPTPTPTPTN